MKTADLRPDLIATIRTFRYDRIIEKHEGPEKWASVLDYYEPEFMVFSGYDVLLPVVSERRPHISLLRCIVSADARTLTLFLKDTFYDPNPSESMFLTGRLAVCEKMDGEEFFIATVYHEWYIVKNAGLP